MDMAELLLTWKNIRRLTMKLFFKKYNVVIKYMIILAISYMTGISLALVSGYGVTGIETMIPCLMLLAGVVYHKIVFDSERNKRDMVMSGIAGFLFALTMVLGSKIDRDDGIFYDFSIMDVGIYPFLGLFFSALVMLLLNFRDKLSLPSLKGTLLQNSEGKSIINYIYAHPFAVLWIFYTICYLPYYLTFFPGNCGKDTWESVHMILGDIPWTNHHPVLFTGLLMIVIKGTAFLGSLALSVGIFSFLQLLSMAAVLSYMSVRICRMHVVWPCKVFTVLFCAFHPFMGMYSIYLTKDVLFAEIMILLCIKLYDVIKEEGKPLGKPAECVSLSVLFLLSSMLRNNGMYIAVVMAVIFLFLYRKYWKNILILFLCAIGLFQIWQGPVFKSIGIEKQSFAEAASIPLQQVGYVLWEDKRFSDEDMEFLEALMPIEKVKEVYEPGYTDPYKFDEDFNDDFLNENAGRFLGVWWNGCKTYFPEYVEAYLMQTVGYWHYGETNSVSTQGIVENTLGIEQYDVGDHITGFSLEPIIEKLVLAGRKAPVICVFGSMAMQMFAVLLLILQYVRDGRGKMCVYLIPLVILWGTIMVATPASCLLRYLFPIFLLWPFMIAEFVSSRQ